MIKLLFDTDCLIDFFRGQNDAKLLIERVRKREIEGYLSVMTLYELYIGALLKGNATKRIEHIQIVKNWFLPLILGEQAMFKAAQIDFHLKTIHRTMDMRDLLIAATAITQNLPLKTRNKKDFEKIPELRLA